MNVVLRLVEIEECDAIEVVGTGDAALVTIEGAAIVASTSQLIRLRDSIDEAIEERGCAHA